MDTISEKVKKIITHLKYDKCECGFYNSMNVNCFVCDKLYCKSHSYCILGDDDMPYCSKDCFLNC